MEKFGIFELLDALASLSALSAEENGGTRGARGDAHGSAADGVQTGAAPAGTPAADGAQPPAAFVQGAAQPLREVAEETQQTAGARALDDFLSRHERIRQSAEKRK